MQSIEMFHKTLDYIHNNPVEAGFVEKAEDWLYSSAGNFYGKKGFIELSYIV
jgi:putative transposase